MIIALTGHRPEDCRSEKDVRTKFRQQFIDISKDDVIEAVVTGMAAGVDLWGGDEALKLGLPIYAARPWTTHEPRKQDAELYVDILANAEKVVNVVESDTYPGPWVYQKRNEWMVDAADRVMAYYSGKGKGGTFNCIKYANKVQVPVRNIYGGVEPSKQELSF